MPSRSLGVASEILWHFTGGPRWDERLQRQLSKPKPSEEAFNALLSILRSKELRVGRYQEIVRVNIQKRIKIKDHKTGRDKLGPFRSAEVTIRTLPVTCVTDIPLALLDEHGKRYGRFALGFHRESMVNAGFNPVFYTLQDRPIIHGFQSSIARIEEVANQLGWVSTQLDSAESEATDLASTTEDPDTETQASELSSSVGYASTDISNVQQILLNGTQELREFMAFVKTFTKTEFKTIFHEREWRSTKSFVYDFDDLAMVIAPRDGKGGNYFSRLCAAIKRTLPRRIPLVPWEDML